MDCGTAKVIERAIAALKKEKKANSVKIKAFQAYLAQNWLIKRIVWGLAFDLTSLVVGRENK
ncbi:hypothetical protein GCM10010924_51680 [Rhizobium wenxiniae]|nr:hypothetical protein GCM10010924_51680 [Rhizobium wenxiniae]